MKPWKWLLSSIVAVATACLLAFGPRANQQIPRDRIVVDYWEKWTGPEQEAMQTIVDDFNTTVGAQKGIFVRHVSTSSISQKTLVATAAGVPPDIAGLYDYNLAQFASMDALMPLEEMAKQRGIDENYYKPAYWKGCSYNGHVYALISTPVLVALHYNKRIFAESADALRAAGLDPNRAPETIDELDAYAKALTVYDSNGRIIRAGFLPLEPNWFINFTCYWFGGDFWDAKNKRFTLTDPAVVRTYQWVEEYAKRFGKDSINSFQSGFGNFDSPQNAFLAGNVVMEQQGPFMANFIFKNKPKMSTVLWPKDVEMTKPLQERRKNYEWAVAPFPSNVPGFKDVTYCLFDALTIPRGARHPREAFEFIAFVNRQDEMEKLCKLHCKNSPLRKVSEDFLTNHPNPYIDVFERLAVSPNARACAQIPIMPEVLAELTTLSQRVALQQVDPKQALEEIQVRMQAKYELFVEQQKKRGSTAF